MENLTGVQLGPYQIVAPLGEGGMAAVYQAYQPAMERYVALKILPRHFAGDPQFAGRFEQEAKVIARLQHPHILPVFDYGQAEGYTYIAMPFIKSGTLAELLKGRPLALGQIREIMSQVGDALDYAHGFGLIHRDIKPSNVLVDERGNCLLTDFGIAKIVEGTAQFTRTGGVIGTPAYMSPEQGTGQKVDNRSDIYSLGVMLYEMATGRVPYQAETPIAVVFKHARDPLPPPRSLNPALPEALERVILKALAKQPEDRFNTAGQMVQAVRTALPDRTLSGSTSIEPQAAGLDTSATRMEAPPTHFAATGYVPAGATVARPRPAPPGPGAGLPPALPVARRGIPTWVWGIGCLAALGLVAVLAVGGAYALGLGPFAVPTATPTATATASASPTLGTPTATVTETAIASSPTATAAVTSAPTRTGTLVPTRTESPTVTLAPPTETPSLTPSATPPPTDTSTPTTVPDFIDQAPYAGDCANRPAGSVCLTFSDGYTWLIYDSIGGSGGTYDYNGQTVAVSLGFQADYHHVLGTNLVKTVPK